MVYEVRFKTFQDHVCMPHFDITAVGIDKLKPEPDEVISYTSKYYTFKHNFLKYNMSFATAQSIQDPERGGLVVLCRRMFVKKITNIYCNSMRM